MKFIASANTTQISHEQDVFVVENGIVDLPPAIGREMQLEVAVETKSKRGNAAAGADDFGALPAAKAIELIAQTSDLDQLKAFENAEKARKDSRKTVLDALYGRLDELKAADDAK